METTSQRELPAPPTFSQMMEDLDIMTSDDKMFKLFQLEQLVEQAKEQGTPTNETLHCPSSAYGIVSVVLESASTGEGSVEQTHRLINQFLARLQALQQMDKSLTAQNDLNNDQLEKKLRDIIEQLQLCLTKLQTNSSSVSKRVLADNKK